MAGGHFYLGGGTAVQQATGSRRLRPRRCTSTWSRCRREPEHRQDPRLLRRQRRALQLVGGLGFSVRAQLLPGQGRRPAGHRGPVVHRQRKGVAVLRAGEARAARPLGAGARRAGRRRDGHRPAASNGPTSSACRSATRPARPTWSSTTVRWSASAGSTSPKPVRSRPSRSIIAAGGFAMNPEMVAEHTPALGQKRRTKHHGVVEPYILGNPNDDGLGIRTGCLGGRRRQEPGPDVHHRRRLPAGDPAHRHHRQQRGPAVRRRGLLPLAHVGLRAGAAGPGRPT